MLPGSVLVGGDHGLLFDRQLTGPSGYKEAQLDLEFDRETEEIQ